MGMTQWLLKKIGDYLTREFTPEHRAHLCDFDRICHEVIPGDVLLVEGNNRISKIIKRVTHSPWTHAALYIGRLHSIEDPELRQLLRKYYHGPAGKQLLIESMVGQGTIVKPITEYTGQHLRICRPTGLSHTDAQHVIGFAIKRLGRKYNTRHFFDLGRFAMAGRILPRRWMSSLFEEKNPSQTTQDICSAMIAEAFTSIKFPILPLIRQTEENKLEMIHRNPRLFTPSDFDYSPYFAIIKYPIYPLSKHGPYHDLPWHEGLFSDDEGILHEHDKKTEDKKSDKRQLPNKTKNA